MHNQGHLSCTGHPKGGTTEGAPMTETLFFPIVLPAIPNFRQRQGNQLRVLINQNAALSG